MSSRSKSPPRTAEDLKSAVDFLNDFKFTTGETEARQNVRPEVGRRLREYDEDTYDYGLSRPVRTDARQRSMWWREGLFVQANCVSVGSMIRSSRRGEHFLLALSDAVWHRIWKRARDITAAASATASTTATSASASAAPVAPTPQPDAKQPAPVVISKEYVAGPDLVTGSAWRQAINELFTVPQTVSVPTATAAATATATSAAAIASASASGSASDAASSAATAAAVTAPLSRVLTPDERMEMEIKQDAAFSCSSYQSSRYPRSQTIHCESRSFKESEPKSEMFLTFPLLLSALAHETDAIPLPVYESVTDALKRKRAAAAAAAAAGKPKRPPRRVDANGDEIEEDDVYLSPLHRTLAAWRDAEIQYKEVRIESYWAPERQAEARADNIPSNTVRQWRRMKELIAGTLTAVEAVQTAVLKLTLSLEFTEPRDRWGSWFDLAGFAAAIRSSPLLSHIVRSAFGVQSVEAVWAGGLPPADRLDSVAAKVDPLRRAADTAASDSKTSELESTAITAIDARVKAQIARLKLLIAAASGGKSESNARSRQKEAKPTVHPPITASEWDDCFTTLNARVDKLPRAGQQSLAALIAYLNATNKRPPPPPPETTEQPAATKPAPTPPPAGPPAPPVADAMPVLEVVADSVCSYRRMWKVLNLVALNDTRVLMEFWSDDDEYINAAGYRPAGRSDKYVQDTVFVDAETGLVIRTDLGHSLGDYSAHHSSHPSTWSVVGLSFADYLDHLMDAHDPAWANRALSPAVTAAFGAGMDPNLISLMLSYVGCRPTPHFSPCDGVVPGGYYGVWSSYDPWKVEKAESLIRVTAADFDFPRPADRWDETAGLIEYDSADDDY